jgi:uncharacterized protein (DUF433 family)
MSPATRHTESTRGDLGQGIYSLDELRQYVAFYSGEPSGDKVLQWLMHALNEVGHSARRPDYSFSDLVSLFVVRELLRLGPPPHEIRSAEAWLRRRWNTDRPFALEDIVLVTDGRRIFVDDEDTEAEQMEDAGAHGQQTFRAPIQQYLKSVTYRGGAAAQWHPVDYVVLDPEVQFGEPVIAGTRLLTSEMAVQADRLGTAKAASTFGVEPQALQSALTFERRLAALRN